MAAMGIRQLENGLWRVKIAGAPVEYAHTPEFAAALASFWKARVEFEGSRREVNSVAYRAERSNLSSGSE